LTNKIPSKSGIVPIEMWISGDGVEVEHIHYNIMYVAPEDVGTISLICVNNVKNIVQNFQQETLLQYAVYNIRHLTTSVIGRYENDKTWEPPSNEIDVNA
jgi:hypothetical protein